VQRILIALILLPVVGCGQGRKSATMKSQIDHGPSVIDAVQAVTIAEQFVREDGYIDFVPQDVSNLKSESRAGHNEYRLRTRRDLRW
jgi:hypothetical protein